MARALPGCPERVPITPRDGTIFPLNATIVPTSRSPWGRRRPTSAIDHRCAAKGGATFFRSTGRGSQIPRACVGVSPAHPLEWDAVPSHERRRTPSHPPRHPRAPECPPPSGLSCARDASAREPPHVYRVTPFDLTPHPRRSACAIERVFRSDVRHRPDRPSPRAREMCHARTDDPFDAPERRAAYAVGIEGG